MNSIIKYSSMIDFGNDDIFGYDEYDIDERQ